VVGDDGPRVSQFANCLAECGTLGNIEDFQCFSKLGVSPVEAAGRWLFLNRETVSGPVIPFLKCRFSLTALQAIDAAKLAHALEYPRAEQ
jgi:hypothetical protein